MAAVPFFSMESRWTRPMVVGPFRPAMRRVLADSVFAEAPQASRLTSMTTDSSRDVSFFIIRNFLTFYFCPCEK